MTMTMKQATAMTLALLAWLLLACYCPNFTTLRIFQNSIVPTAAPFLLSLKSHPSTTQRPLIPQQQHATNSAATNTQEFSVPRKISSNSRPFEPRRRPHASAGGRRNLTAGRGPEIHILMEIPNFGILPAILETSSAPGKKEDTKIYTKSAHYFNFFHFDLDIGKSLILPISKLEIIFSYNFLNFFLIY
jgi:hypothetical protein